MVCEYDLVPVIRETLLSVLEEIGTGIIAADGEDPRLLVALGEDEIYLSDPAEIPEVPKPFAVIDITLWRDTMESDDDAEAARRHVDCYLAEWTAEIVAAMEAYIRAHPEW